MKKNVYIIIPLLSILFSCEDIFDRKPLDRISEADVWEDEAMVRAYITRLYNQFPHISGNLLYTTSWHNFTDEATLADGNNNSIVSGGASKTHDNLPYWDYGYIRDINVGLEKLKDSPFAEIRKNEFEGELRVMRAVAYFQMQKRYGGVPLVDVVIDPFSSIDKEYTERKAEEAIADFIDSELNAAISLLPEKNTPKGKINKWVAYAYKARANLWAGSIAKYGSVQLNGLVGIPASRANDFFSKASSAANEVITSGMYSLYNEYPDKAENYQNLFLDESNMEIIFEKKYDGVNFGHSWHHMNAPTSFSSGRGSYQNPLLEFIMGYENIDGSDTQPLFGPENLYENGYGPFQNKDPRLFATVFFQGDSYAGGTIETYEGIDTNPTPDPNSILSSPALLYMGIPTVGKDSRKLASAEKSTNSGFSIKKYISNEPFLATGNDPTNWIAVRLAEMYLIQAEAEFEMGNLDKAAEALNATRERAGISLVDQETITLKKVRNERRSELSYEGFRYWDLRRWRTAESVLNMAQFQGLRIILHYETGEYYFLPIDAELFSRVFRQEHYYNPITDSRISNNLDLVENPLY